MVVVKLMGGLGNQMFQYAAGKALAIKNNAPLFVDVSFLNSDPNGQYTKRELELTQLNVQLNIADAKIIAKFHNRKLNRLLYYFRPAGSIPVILNDSTEVDPSFYRSDVYLDGFWQSESYFSSVRNILLREFTPAYDPGKIGSKYSSLAQEQESVAIHVRRGDYVSLVSASEFHGVCGMDYYNPAIQYISTRLKDPKFFVFSDDLEWCRNNFKELPNVTYMDTRSSYQSLDLFLMSYCKHNIIANSSFSWWAAWLNTNEGKMVIAPGKWFSGKTAAPGNIYCKDWIKI